jgi:O-antigen/teichoic acid export membrane protein
MLFKKIKTKIEELSQQSLVQDTLWLLVARFLTVILQAGYFIIVARTLGSEEYGGFIGVTALASLCYPFAALGCEHLLVQEVSRNRARFRTYWGNALLVIIFSSITLTLILLLLSPFIFPKSIAIEEIFIILLADLTCLAVFEVSGKAFLAIGVVKNSAKLQTFYICSKCISAICLAALFDKPSSMTWAILYLLGSLVAAVVGVIMVNHLVASPRPKLSKIRQELSQGIFFSISASAQNINIDLDKTMLTSMSTLQATGIYGAAYRFIDVGLVPLHALMGASYPKFFQKGASGINATFKFAVSLLPFTIAYGIISIISYQVFAPFVPMILGEEYIESIEALRWLAPIPFIATFQLLAADTLTGAGLQKVRSFIQVGAAILNFSLNFVLIPTYSWQGAAWATLISDSLRAICLWIFVFVLVHKHSNDKVVNTKNL